MAEKITPKQKLERLTIKYPELKQVLRQLSDPNRFKELRDIKSNLKDKTVLIGRDSGDVYLWYQLAHILNSGYLHTTRVTTVDLLESYLSELEDIPRLSQVEDDLVIIRDTRAFVPNKQKPNMVSQVFEQNQKVIYYYSGTYPQFLQDMADFKNYCEDNHIPIIQLGKSTRTGDDEII